MSGEDVQEQPTVKIPLGGQWWVTRIGTNDDPEPFYNEKAAKVWGGANSKPEYRPREVVVARPSDGQALVLTRVQRMLERGEIANALMAFGDVLDAMLIDEDDRGYAYQGLATGSIKTEDYADLLLECMRHFGLEAQANGRPGAAPPRKRAAARKR